MSEKLLGRIHSITFGHGGYDDAMLGVSLEFRIGEGESSGVGTFLGAWDPEFIKVSDHTKWTETDRERDMAACMRAIALWLKQAKVHDVYQLKGKPVEVTFEGNMLRSWRLLTEVL